MGEFGGRKIGRNEPCPCESGKKFKHCHGGHEYQEVISEGARQAHQHAMIHRIQRERQQGLGRGIVSAEVSGRRIVAIHSRMLTGQWKTFHDFLFDYIKTALTPEWGNAELAKPATERHPLLNWYQLCCAEQAKHIKTPGVVHSALMTGAVAAYLGLAYDLYTLEHNGAQADDPELQAKLIARLKNTDQFIGVRNEIKVAATLLRAGFQLAWEDETDRRRTHCEFTATYPPTGRAFGVECKIRQPPDGRPVTSKLGKFVGLLAEALRKDTPHDRIVFIDLNTPAQEHTEAAIDWLKWAVGRVRLLERDPLQTSLPPAFVLLTTYPYHHELETVAPPVAVMAEGFKVDDYRYDRACTLREAIEARERHPEMEALMTSIREHFEIPVTFDGAIPELEPAQGQRLLVGRRYLMDDGKIGLLTSATVAENESRAYLCMTMNDGQGCIYSGELSAGELAAWRRYPDTFFGELGARNRESKNLLELYDFFLETYRNTPKETLLGFMEGSKDREGLAALSQLELAKLYCEGMANSVAAMDGQKSPG